jgi:prepilin-type N-terminal cleavage/methylation domain-containing protein
MKQANTSVNSAKLSARQGYTLVELMVAILVISISVLALYQMLISGKTLIQEENHRRVALERVQYHMERLKFIESDSGYVPVRYAGNFVEELIPAAPGQEDGIQEEHTIHIEPSQERDQKNKPIYSHVAIELSWLERSGRRQFIRMEANF